MTTPIFFPRPEAHPMKWDALMPPLKRAVRDLLVRIEGATSMKMNDGDAVANCFLVYGERGTGKSTVLLSAKYACEYPGNQKNDFFSDQKLNQTSMASGCAPGTQETYNEKQAPELRKDAQHSAEKAKNVVWLDVLDMEPLPSRINLLATVLTRVRNALCQSGPDKEEHDFTSILEDGPGHLAGARQKFGQLISDGAMMWQEIDESDTRSSANRNVDAADKYARFKNQFQDAMKTLSTELARRNGERNVCYQIVLPIDNIDRSTEHLHNIIKLAQMLSCPYLWLVFAGDRQDIETFLERAYWKELIRVGEGAGGMGKADSEGEDETLVMARRQAAAASHKLLPPSHRIEVEFVNPEDTLKFPSKGNSADSKTIQELLKEIKVKKAGTSYMDFIDFFCTRNFVNGSMGEIVDDQKQHHHQYFTTVAKLGLHLPARGVIDLWRLAYWVKEDGTIEADYQAEKIARTMLRNSIAESTMSNKIGRCFQEKIIQRNVNRGTRLVFGDLNPVLKAHLSRLLAFSFRTSYKIPILILQEGDAGVTEVDVRSILTIRQVSPMTMALKSSPKDNVNNNEDMLPDLINAWLIVLCDIAEWSKNSGIRWPEYDKNPIGSVCIVIHEVLNSRDPACKASLTWPMPDWSTFMENEVCGQFWDFFLNHLDERGALFDQAGREDCLPRLLAIGWVACSLQTFSLFAAGDWKWAQDIFRHVTKTIKEGAPDGFFLDVIVNAEKIVIGYAAELYQKILQENNSNGAISRFSEGMDRMRSWLERDLPLMWLTDIYVPPCVDLQQQIDAVFDTLDDTDLASYWKKQRHHIDQRQVDAWGKLVGPSSLAGR